MLTNISEIILAFVDWNAPWIFHESVSDALRSNPTGYKLFEDIWISANNEELWLSAPDLQAAVQETTKRLMASYPELTHEAALAISRAVSYQWR